MVPLSSSSSTEIAAQRCAATAALVNLKKVIETLPAICGTENYGNMISAGQQACNTLWKLVGLAPAIVQQAVQQLELDQEALAQTLGCIVGLAYHQEIPPTELTALVCQTFGIPPRAWGQSIREWRKRVYELMHPSEGYTVTAAVLALSSEQGTAYQFG